MATTVLGLEFYNGAAEKAVAAAKGLCVFPSAPGLATLDTDVRYREALVAADTRYVDSGFLTLAWMMITGEKLSRISGLRFLKAFLAAATLRQTRSLWIHPTPLAQTKNKNFLEIDCKIPATLMTHVVAPVYPADAPIADLTIPALCQRNHPQVIVINLGSNTQEPLGAYLKANLPYAPLILCTGGAIDFLTGAQAAIPPWADRLFLGWLLRILTTPQTQAAGMRVSPSKRYLRAFRLAGLLQKWKRALPQ